ncbi:sodium:solute symporter family transporter [Kribbella sp. CWNU-51]
MRVQVETFGHRVATEVAAHLARGGVDHDGGQRRLLSTRAVSVGYIVGCLMLLVLVAAPLRRSGAYTLPDFAETRFESRWSAGSAPAWSSASARSTCSPNCMAPAWPCKRPPAPRHTWVLRSSR